MLLLSLAHSDTLITKFHMEKIIATGCGFMSNAQDAFVEKNSSDLRMVIPDYWFDIDGSNNNDKGENSH